MITRMAEAVELDRPCLSGLSIINTSSFDR